VELHETNVLQFPLHWQQHCLGILALQFT